MMLQDDPDARATILDVLNHPFFWGYSERNAFFENLHSSLRDLDTLMYSLRSIEKKVIPGLPYMGWDQMIDEDILQRHNDWRQTHGLPLLEGHSGKNVSELITFVHNTRKHHLEWKGFNLFSNTEPIFYFGEKFPHLLIELWKLVRQRRLQLEEDLKRLTRIELAGK